MSPDSLETSTCLERLKALKAGSRLGAKDSSLFAGISGAAEHASGFMGWTDLSSNPPLSVEEIAAIADGIRADGLEAVVLLGQGGSSQASMTITKLNEVSTGRRDALAGDFVDALFSNRMQAVSVNDSDSSLDNVKSLNSTSSGIKHAKDAVTNNFASGVFSTKKTPEVSFRTMDSLSPVFVNHILGASDPARTLYIVSSKSGSTIEPLMLERVVWRYVTGHLGTAGAGKRFVAITDPGSSLEQHAAQRGYRLVLNSPKSVGGRFSALTVFALFPAALIGIDIISAIKHVSATEAACRKDDDANPASKLACFIYSNYLNGRDKLSFVMPSSGQVFGLWLEQLVAESLGKMGIGILPNVEVDASILSVARNDRCVITYELGRVEGFH
ncbi:MAG: hypothetical protein LBG97_04060, partial [Coriobacteriales bacterium]|nr:hypothetical protein [Coriobacteriales bacterium]